MRAQKTTNKANSDPHKINQETTPLHGDRQTGEAVL
jgi:hypothetical protein